MPLFYIDEVREMIKQFNGNEISIGKFAELLDEKAKDAYHNKVKINKNMKIIVEVKDEAGNIEQCVVMRSYLGKFVDHNKEYPVPYTIQQDGTRVYKPAMIKGEDLTENQIAIIFSKMLL